MIIHSTTRGFICHLLILVFIFTLTIVNLIISSLAIWGNAKPAAIVLGCINLIALFAYSMYISSTYSLIKNPEDPRKSFLKLTGFSSKGYTPTPPCYEDENEDSSV